MTNFMFMIIVVNVLAVIILFGTVFGKQLRVKMKGRTDEVMRQDAQTPEGEKITTMQRFERKRNFTTEHQRALQKFQGNDRRHRTICEMRIKSI